MMTALLSPLSAKKVDNEVHHIRVVHVAAMTAGREDLCPRAKHIFKVANFPLQQNNVVLVMQEAYLACLPQVRFNVA